MHAPKSSPHAASVTVTLPAWTATAVDWHRRYPTDDELRTIAEYALDIWGVTTHAVTANAEHCLHEGICLTEKDG